MADSTIVVSDANDVDRTLRTDEVATVHTPKHIVQSSALPDGASTSALQNTGNTSLTSLATTVASGQLQVDLVDIAGASTSALQNTGNGLLGTIDGDTGALAGCVTGNELQVDIVASAAIQLAAGTANIGALTAGTAAIGSLTAGTASIGTVVLGAGSAAVGTIALGAGSAAVGTVALGAGAASIGTLGANSGTDIGDVDVTSVAVPTTVYHGRKLVTALTDEVIAGSQALKSGVTVKANAGNVGLIYVGVENVAAATGFELSAKESIFIEIDNTNRIWLDAATGSADGITYIAS